MRTAEHANGLQDLLTRLQIFHEEIRHLQTDTQAIYSQWLAIVGRGYPPAYFNTSSATAHSYLRSERASIWHLYSRVNLLAERKERTFEDLRKQEMDWWKLREALRAEIKTGGDGQKTAPNFDVLKNGLSRSAQKINGKYVANSRSKHPGGVMNNKSQLLERGNKHKAVAAARLVTLDYPLEGEKVRGAAGYTFRIGAPANAHTVEVSINGGPWQSCRRAVGYWWFDWSEIKPGAYQVRAKARDAIGEIESAPRRCFCLEK